MINLNCTTVSVKDKLGEQRIVFSLTRIGTSKIPSVKIYHVDFIHVTTWHITISASSLILHESFVSWKTVHKNTALFSYHIFVSFFFFLKLVMISLSTQLYITSCPWFCCAVTIITSYLFSANNFWLRPSLISQKSFCLLSYLCTFTISLTLLIIFLLLFIILSHWFKTYQESLCITNSLFPSVVLLLLASAMPLLSTITATIICLSLSLSLYSLISSSCSTFRLCWISWWSLHFLVLKFAPWWCSASFLWSSDYWLSVFFSL